MLPKVLETLEKANERYQAVIAATAPRIIDLIQDVFIEAVRPDLLDWRLLAKQALITKLVITYKATQSEFVE